MKLYDSWVDHRKVILGDAIGQDSREVSSTGAYCFEVGRDQVCSRCSPSQGVCTSSVAGSSATEANPLVENKV